MNQGLYLFILMGVVHTLAMYSPSDDVVELTPANFDKEVTNSKGVWIVEFYAPWCGHCQQFAPEYKKLATALKGFMHVGAVDADQHKSLGGRFGVQGFPTIKIFGSNKNKPTDYNGDRKAESISAQAFSAMREIISSRLGHKPSGSEGGQKTSSDEKDVIVLTDSNFEDKVIKSDEMWLVEFYAPWCGHCKNLAPHWASAATELKGKVNVAKIDGTTETIMSGKYGIRGFPTIKFFPSGKKEFDSAQEYTGGRTSESIVSWALEKWSSQLPPPDVYQLTDQDVLDKCAEKQLCFISFLPHILDSGAEGRNGYIDTAKAMADKYKQRSFGWVWIEALLNPDLESTFDVGGSGYPALIAVNIRKSVYSSMRGPYSSIGIKDFVRDLGSGRGGTVPIKGDLPAIPSTEPWDGKDGELPIEEDDYDLSDVDMDDEPLKEEL